MLLYAFLNNDMAEHSSGISEFLRYAFESCNPYLSRCLLKEGEFPIHGILKIKEGVHQPVTGSLWKKKWVFSDSVTAFIQTDIIKV